MNIKQNKASLLVPILFVTLYGSGFVGTKYGLAYANPLSFLSSRFLIAALILAGLAFYFNQGWKIQFQKIDQQQVRQKLIETGHIAIAGLLTVAVFSIGVFVSIDMGLSPSLSAMIIALQPILVAILAARFINEHISLKQWIGLILGLIGVTIVLMRNVEFSHTGIMAILMSVLALIGLSIGNLYQKRFCSEMNLLSGGAIQSAVSGLACLFLLLLFSEYRIEWSSDFIYALAYMTVGVSVGALTLLYIMIRKGSVSKVASLFYLMPVSAAVVSFLIYDEVLSLVTLLGMAIVMVGISLTLKTQQN